MSKQLPKEVHRRRVRQWCGGADEHCTFRVIAGDATPELTGANTITVGRNWLYRNGIPPEDLD
jgi:hypothetical protein